ncbi:helix-turn-helix domain-containing protein [Actinoplanes sp. TBRC 11911]|uniref:helix-turn-helix domain-containing protein n=1 Tax=Actinoplanes sp. TBRC 11911 TaxID=2729386 RepID=UPI00145C7CBD|nr:helix-turn-helix domain-containing protein [Actinoplanes sp. TBRC 11911]NMO50067.1 helix-turn-helix domain-containing protein [Actinoplanes sp. TBRC 11911]
MVLTYTLQSAADLERVAAATYMPVVATPRDKFRGMFAAHELGEVVTLTEAHGTPLHTFRTERMAAHARRDDLLFFSVHRAGTATVRQGGRVASLGPGSGVLYEARSAWDLNVETTVHSLLLHFPRSALGLPSAEITAALARTVAAASAAMELFTAYIEQLTRVADGLSAAQRHAAGLVGIDMLAMILRGSTDAMLRGDNADAVLLETMRHHVRERLADPELTVSALARRHHVSVRRTHELFARTGVTPGFYIREQRLLAARAMLSDARFARRAIAQIAAGVGFPHLRTFERAFVRRYGITPAQWRHEAQERSQSASSHSRR